MRISTFRAQNGEITMKAERTRNFVSISIVCAVCNECRPFSPGDCFSFSFRLSTELRVVFAINLELNGCRHLLRLHSVAFVACHTFFFSPGFFSLLSNICKLLHMSSGKNVMLSFKTFKRATHFSPRLNFFFIAFHFISTGI